MSNVSEKGVEVRSRRIDTPERLPWILISSSKVFNKETFYSLNGLYDY